MQITISPALLQQAAALHRSQTSNTTLNTPVSKIISLDLSQVFILGFSAFIIFENFAG